MEVEKMAQCIYSNGSPAQQLLLQVGARGMTVRHLVELLDKLRLDTILIDLVEYRKYVQHCGFLAMLHLLWFFYSVLTSAACSYELVVHTSLSNP